jgi:serine/threonine protein kinase
MSSPIKRDLTDEEKTACLAANRHPENDVDLLIVTAKRELIPYFDIVVRTIVCQYAATLTFGDVIVLDRIGGGHYGAVYRGTWHGMDVAVKELFLSSPLTPSRLSDFEQFGQKLQAIDFPFINRVYGVCVNDNKLFVVSELAHNTLWDSIFSSDEWPWLKRCRVALDIARGLEHAHEHLARYQTCLHPMNILVHKDTGNCMISNIGFIPDKYRYIERLFVGHHRYLAPELTRIAFRPTPASDVFAFGTVLSEIGLRRSLSDLLSECKDDADKGHLRMNRVRQEFPSEYDRLIESCFHKKPRNRPSSKDLVCKLTSIVRSLEIEELNNDRHEMDKPLSGNRKRKIEALSLDCIDKTM